MNHRRDYLYPLPEELIAQYPVEKRDSSRLLILDCRKDTLIHGQFPDLIEYLQENDVLVLNNTRVIPARLLGRRHTGGVVELLLLRQIGENEWDCLVKPAKRLKPGHTVLFPEDCVGEVLTVGKEGRRTLRFHLNNDFHDWLPRIGQAPLPPYIRRAPNPEDCHRYQTVYAEKDGAVAAPTAGLHFTEALLQKIHERGVRIAKITLHVGIGTFRPVMVENLNNHRMDAEVYEVNPTASEIINSARRLGGRIFAVGTTVVRTLETVADARGVIHPGSGETKLFIRPPYRFKAIDALITNFHLPGSTLIMLVSAFAGRDRILKTYTEAVHLKYRFFSYGDAMLILGGK